MVVKTAAHRCEANGFRCAASGSSTGPIISSTWEHPKNHVPMAWIAQYRSYDTWKRHGELRVGVVRGKEAGHLILSDDLGTCVSTAASRLTPILQQALTQSGRYQLRDCPMTALWWGGRDGSRLKSGPRPAFGANPAYQIFCAASVNSCQHLHCMQQYVDLSELANWC